MEKPALAPEARMEKPTLAPEAVAPQSLESPFPMALPAPLSRQAANTRQVAPWLIPDCDS